VEFYILDTSNNNGFIKEFFSRLKQRDSHYKTLPSDCEWDFAKAICEKLEIFFRVTELFSSTKYPATNLCFPNLCEIRLQLRGWLSSTDLVVKSMAAKMVAKFDKYWSGIHGIVGVAAVLDPRYKMTVLEFYFDKVF
jgi:hypothetical protein